MEPSIHLGIIPDGNRRWCRIHNKDRFEYSAMIKQMICNAFAENQELVAQANGVDSQPVERPFPLFGRVKELSVYLLSKENCERQDGTMELIEHTMDMLVNLLRVEQYGKSVRFIVHGERTHLTPLIRDQLDECVALSTGSFPVHIAIGYDPIEDSKAYLNEGVDSRRPIDLVVRSGGQLRSSGFFPLQTLYSEWVYYDTLWPDMTRELVHDALITYSKRTRNFGK